MSNIKTVIAAAAFVAVGGMANAATCAGDDRSITLSPSASCFASSHDSANDNIGNGTEDWLSLGYVEIDDTGDAGTGYLSGDTNAGTSGDITVSGDLSAYSDLLLGLKIGGQDDIIWGVFTIAGPGTYSWSTDSQQALSHTVLYGKMGEVPLPAAGFLLLGGLGGLAFMRRRKS